MRRDAATETTLYNFTAGGPNYPTAALIADASGALYGTADFGGSLAGNCGPPNWVGCGGVFKLTPAGSGYIETTLYEFQGGTDGISPFPGLYMDSSGALYGTTPYGGSYACGFSLGCGTVFKLTPKPSGGYNESLLHVFQGGTDGFAPTGGLIGDASGALYGTTEEGGDKTGVAGDGTVFKLTPHIKGPGYSKRVLHQFQGCSAPSGPCDGANPDGSLYMDAKGALYGTTLYGGSQKCPNNNLCGTVFRLSPDVTNPRAYHENVLYNFKGGSDGATPVGALIADSHGALYGATTLGGGANAPACNFGSVVRGCGTVFKLTPGVAHPKHYTESVLYAFQGGSDGAAPQAGVIADASGALYGTTQLGGTGYGTVFKLSPAGSTYTESVMYAFHGDGQAPRAGLLLLNGAFYGTTFQGGGGTGIVFRLIP
jgi:uncharacterized repeat protein (TIGR03803 family)